ncbi:MAG: hypothetical protein HY343_10075 [Lentisphaerae bacterium]|nr:hypothetical protein [Lentisphaerota bacterium]
MTGLSFKGIGRRLGLAGISLAGSLLAAEALVRLFFPVHVWQVPDASRDWQADARLGWTQKPNYVSVGKRPTGAVVRFETNGDGVQPATAQPARTAGQTRIMIFGDSTVVGRSVPEDQRLHSRLRTLLGAAGHPAEVINAGVEGYSTDQSLIRMEILLPRYRPDVVIHCVCGNDFWGNVRGTNSGLSKPRYVLTDNGSLREQAPAPNAKLATATKWPIAWIHRSALYGLAWPTLTVWRARYGTVQDRMLLGLTDAIYVDSQTLESIDWNLFQTLLRRMRSVCDARGARFLFYATPDLPEVWNPWIEKREKTLRLGPGQYDRYALEKRLQQISDRDKLDFVPMIGVFLKQQDRGPFHLLPADRHCNDAGYRLTAEALAQAVGDELNNRTRASP